MAGAVERLNAKMGGEGFDGTAKFVIEDEGAVMIDQSGAHAGDEPADVTLTASRETFEGMLNGEENATAAYMSGRLKVDGDMGAAMRLSGLLS
ncbi:sterol carrier family protein [Oceanicola granulosus HTCC2516]|uniref:Sterol carrier family protein n=1 Tax=Oceanicola granulosus (strain ATCC BAA-861 / DSM 15982 / KCTC 12143 / HTCC2516) TaxID=314256 RepID=Q2CEQ5_OCEGH|nr:sterol carrier family protein [Oceanicola granulosus HTCC2516]